MFHCINTGCMVDTDFSTHAVNPFKIEVLNESRAHACVTVSTNLKSSAHTYVMCTHIRPLTHTVTLPM